MTDTKPDPALEPVQAEELSEEQLDQANGGIIAILIGIANQPKKPGGANVILGDGSVRN